MPRISFNLSSEKLNTGGMPGGLDAPMLRGGASSSMDAPQIRPAMQEATTLPTPKGGVPILDDRVVQAGFSKITQAAISYQDRTDELYAEDASLRYNLQAREILEKVPQEGEKAAPGFLRLQGKPAIDAREEYEAKLKATRDEIAGSLGENARAKFLAKSSDRHNSHLNKMADHHVKQQEWFNGQVIYGTGEDLKKDLYENPFGVLQEGRIHKFLSMQKSKEDVVKAETDITSFIVDSLVAQDPLNGPKMAKAFSTVYAKTALSKESLNGMDKKIQIAEDAARIKLEREEKDTTERRRVEMMPEVMRSLSDSLSKGNGVIYSDIISKMSGFRPKGESDKVEKDQEEAVRNSLRFGYNNRVPVEQLESQFHTAYAQGESVGKSMGARLYNIGINELDSIKRDREAGISRTQEAAASQVVSSYKYNPGTGELELGVSETDIKRLPLKSTDKEKFLQMWAKGGKVQVDKLTSAQYNDRLAYWDGLEYEGKLVPGTPGFDSFSAAMKDPNQMLKPSDMKEILGRAYKDPAEKTDKDPRVTSVKELIQTAAVQGRFSTQLSNRKQGKEFYKKHEIDPETTQAVGRETRLLNQWVKDNPGKDPHDGWWKPRQEQLKENIVPGANYWSEEEKLTKAGGEPAATSAGAPAAKKDFELGKPKAAPTKAAEPAKGYGLREDGTQKGKGWLGEIKTSTGEVMTEKSIGVHIGGNPTLIPAIVPTLSPEEIQHLASGGDVTPAIEQKAAQHAIKQMKEGKGVWADNNLPPEVMAEVMGSAANRKVWEDAKTPEAKAAIIEITRKALQKKGGK